MSWSGKQRKISRHLSFMLFVMLSVSFVVRYLYVQFFMTLRPSTKFQLSHSCHNTIFDRIGSLSLPHPLEKERERVNALKLQLFISIASVGREAKKSPIFWSSSASRFLCFYSRCIPSFSPGHEEWLASLPFLSCNHLAVSSHSCDDVARALFLPKTPE